MMDTEKKRNSDKKGDYDKGEDIGEKKDADKKRIRKKIIIVAIEILVILLVLLAIAIGLKMSKVDSNNEIPKEELQKNELTVETKEVLEKYTTIALFGLDNRSNGDFEWGNSDVIMVASINESTKEVKLVSVYRDTYLNMTENKGYKKANAAFANGGVEQAVNMLNVNLDLDIEDYVIVDFNAVATTVDLLGGVEIEVTDEEAFWMQMYIDEMNDVLGENARYLPGAGVYNMNGVQATAYARVRYTAGDDYKRTERQRLVIQKMVEKALQSDLGTINAIIDEVFGKIKTSFSMTEILMLAKDAFSYKMGENAGFPFDQIATNIGGKYGDVVIPLDLAGNVEQLHEFLYDTQDYKVTETVQEISDAIVTNTGWSADDIPN